MKLLLRHKLKFPEPYKHRRAALISVNNVCERFVCWRRGWRKHDHWHRKDMMVKYYDSKE